MRVSNCGRVSEKEVVVKVNGYYTTLTKVTSTKDDLCYNALAVFVTVMCLIYFLFGD